jgi:hypothetical protein
MQNDAIRCENSNVVFLMKTGTDITCAASQAVPEENTCFEEHLRTKRDTITNLGLGKLALDIAIERNYDKSSFNISQTVRPTRLLWFKANKHQ